MAPADSPGEVIARPDRHQVKLSGRVIREDGSSVRLAVVDLSYDGCGIECGEALRPGEPIRLFVADCSGMDARVRWCSDGKAGLVFDAGAQPANGKQPRQSERNLTVGQVTIRRRGGDRCCARVFDASPNGCKVEIGANLGEAIWIRFDGLQPLEAEVTWVDRSNAGVRFITPMHAAVFDLLLQRLKHSPRYEHGRSAWS